MGHDAISNVESAVALGENSLADRSLDDLKSIGYDPLNKRVKMDSDGSNKEFVFDTDADKTRYTQLSKELIELKKEANNLETEFASIVNEKNKANLSSEEERDIEQRLNQKSAELDSKLSEIKLKEDEKNKLVSVWRATAGAVSVGDHDIGITRQITNLAAGSEDTDAVNVAQLKSLKNAGLKFAMNDYDKNQVDSTKDKLIKTEIGSIFQIQGKRDFVYNDANKAKYTSDNLVTFNDSGVLRIGMLKSPSFTGVTLGEGDKTVSLTVDDGALKAGGKTIFTEDNFKKFFTKLYTFEGGLKTEEKDGKTVVSLDKETIKQMPELKGEKGDKGDTGLSAKAQWLVDNPGKTDADYATAMKGEKGDKGDTGLSAKAQWLADNPGKTEADYATAIKGDKGDTGLSAKAQWLVDNPGKTDADYATAMKGEKGDKGDTGLSAKAQWLVDNPGKTDADYATAMKGEKGDKGDTGLSAKAQWLADNPGKTDADYATAMKGEQGPKGEKGKSAYESWKKLPANQGKSETEFAEMLGGGASKVELQQLRTEHDSLKAQIRKDQQSIQQLDRNMQKMNKDLRAGIAGATAIAFLQGGNFAGESAVSVAVGTYKGEHALAVGYGRRLTNNKIEIKLGASVNSQSDVNAGGSVGYHW